MCLVAQRLWSASSTLPAPVGCTFDVIYLKVMSVIDSVPNLDKLAGFQKRKTTADAAIGIAIADAMLERAQICFSCRIRVHLQGFMTKDPSVKC